MMQIEIIYATVLLCNNAMDRISLYTNYPSPIPKCQDNLLTLTFLAEKNTGVDYVKKNFGLVPIIIKE